MAHTCTRVEPNEPNRALRVWLAIAAASARGPLRLLSRQTVEFRHHTEGEIGNATTTLLRSRRVDRAWRFQEAPPVAATRERAATAISFAGKTSLPLAPIRRPAASGCRRVERMPYARLTDLNMYYEELGSAAAPTLILLHGAGGSADDPVGGWAALAPSFAEAFHVYLIEHRGHGRTNNPAAFMTFELIGADIAAFAEQLELGPVHLAGISDGGVVALDCAIRRPQLTRTITALGANYCVHEGILNVAASLAPDALEESAPKPRPSSDGATIAASVTATGRISCARSSPTTAGTRPGRRTTCGASPAPRS